MRNFGCYCYSLSKEHEQTGTPKLSLLRCSKNSTQWQCLIARAKITWRLSYEEINKSFRNFKYVIVQKLCLTRPRQYHFLRCACRIYQLINLADNTKLPCYTLPPRQHRGLFRMLPRSSNFLGSTHELSQKESNSIAIFIVFHATEKMKSFTFRALTYHAMNI